jgi:hypothetical protein
MLCLRILIDVYFSGVDIAMDTACHHASPIEDTSLEPDMGCSSKHNRTQPEILTINAAETLDIISAVLHWNRLFSGILVELRPGFTKMRVVSHQCMPIGHVLLAYPHSQVPQDMSCTVLLLLLLVPAASMAIIVLRSSWPWGLGNVGSAACSGARSCIYWEGCCTSTR